jgi:hypothetical protein
MQEPSLADERDCPNWPSPMGSSRGRAIGLVLLVLSFVLFAVPVLRSQRLADPLTGTVTDHIRNRYCASKLVAQPFRSLTVPLGDILRADDSRHGIASWGDTPCTQAGPVFFLVHAPFQWLVESEMVSPARATSIYVLLMLACAQLFFLVALRLDGVWPAALLLYPWVTSSALMGLATPLTCLLGLLAFRDYAAGRHFRATLVLALAVSSYNRWLVILPGIVYLLAMVERGAAWQDLRAHWRFWRGRLLVLGGLVYLGWCVGTMILVWVVRKPIPDPTSPLPVVLRYAVLVGFALALALRHRSAVAAVGTSFGIFFATFGDAMLSWYIEPLIPVFALARKRWELLLWLVLVVVASEAFDRVPNLAETRVLLGWLFGNWASLLG